MQDEGGEVCHRHADDPDDDAVEEERVARVAARPQDADHDGHVGDAHPQEEGHHVDDASGVADDLRRDVVQRKHRRLDQLQEEPTSNPPMAARYSERPA
jgi:hypothetical protein